MFHLVWPMPCKTTTHCLEALSSGKEFAMDILENRRPVNARNWKIIQLGARWLSLRKITPNQISLASIGFAALSAICLISMREVEPDNMWAPSFLAVLFILGRALCNVFDGMVAIEGGKKTKSGELFNDLPDRVSD